MYYCHMESPVGELLLAGYRHALHLISFPSDGHAAEPEAGWELAPRLFTVARHQLAEYFAGQRRHFELELAPHGTPFQLEVLRALQQIPFGETRSYRDIAERIARPRAVRAVGSANARNPLPIVIPCHRVIGADGSLSGFGGGVQVKRYLLELEASVVACNELIHH